MASSSSEPLSEREANRFCRIRRVVAVVGDTLRERGKAGEGDLEEAIAPAISSYFEAENVIAAAGSGTYAGKTLEMVA